MVIKLFGANTSIVIRNVEERLKKINAALPEGIKIIPYYDQKTLVEACVRTVKDSLFQGVLLVALVLFVFIGGVRGTIIVTGAIIFSIFLTFILMNYYKISANLMTLGGLAIAIGMLVDLAIVMVENCERHFQLPQSKDQSKNQDYRRCMPGNGTTDFLCHFDYYHCVFAIAHSPGGRR